MSEAHTVHFSQVRIQLASQALPRPGLQELSITGIWSAFAVYLPAILCVAIAFAMIPSKVLRMTL